MKMKMKQKKLRSWKHKDGFEMLAKNNQCEINKANEEPEVN